MKNIRLLSLFSGIGAFECALDNLNISYELVNYCEFDKDISKAYSLIHNVPEELNLGDINTVIPHSLSDFDIMTYGFPCQDISALGNQDGFITKDGELTRSGLFFQAFNIANAKKPKVLIAENVQALTFKKMKKDFKKMLSLLDDAGYNSYYKVLNSKNFGVPQSRNRVFIVSVRKDVDNGTFEFPSSEGIKSVKASELYETDKERITDDLYLNEKQQKYYNDFRLKKKYSSLNSDIAICMTTRQGQKSNPQNFIQDNRGVRIFTAGEMFAFQGFKREYGYMLLDNGFTMSKIGHMVGNSITVPVVEKILDNIIKVVP